MQSETFDPSPITHTAAKDSILFDPAVHGSTGPVNVSYSTYVYDASAPFFQSLNLTSDLVAESDPNSGQAIGPSFLPVNINPEDQMRYTARSAYYDSVADRPNLYVLTGNTVTRLYMEAVSSNPVPSTDSGDDDLGPPSTGSWRVVGLEVRIPDVFAKVT